MKNWLVPFWEEMSNEESTCTRRSQSLAQRALPLNALCWPVYLEKDFHLIEPPVSFVQFFSTWSLCDHTRHRVFIL
ncbi:unnamed protein product [Haemonchus placei]|uniref:Ovule protein n=1 Tax=Haemonchus placei TaxID=6290 RepID=A0A0N4WV07_HAEPC|nr:unnamed protein product [Haemonchus placei]